MTWFPFHGVYSTVTTGLPITLPKNFSPLLPKRPTWCSSLSLALQLGIQGKKRRSMIISLADPACLKCRCDSVRSWHLLSALQSLLWATPDAYTVGTASRASTVKILCLYRRLTHKEEWVCLASISSSIVVCKTVSRRGREERRQKQLSRCCRGRDTSKTI